MKEAGVPPEVVPLKEEISTEEEEDEITQDVMPKAEFNGKRFCCWLWGIVFFFSVLAYCLLYVSSGEATMFFQPRPKLNQTQKELITEPQVTLSSLIALQRSTQLQSCLFCIISCGAVILSTMTSAAVATLDPKKVPDDFESKGTLSNVSQDVATPHGRMFTVSLFTASLLSLISMYTTTLYRPWSPALIIGDNPFMKVAFAPRWERRWRLAWVIIPNVGFMFTAAIPSMSGDKMHDAWENVLTATHNLFAPLSMAFAVVMETVQLSYGENAFYSFWNSGHESTDFYGPLSNCQRLRVIVCIYAWASAGVFLGIQTYLGMETVVGLKIRKSYRLALISFYGEVLGMIFAFALPALQAIEVLDWDRHSGTIMHEANALLGYLDGNSAAILSAKSAAAGEL